MEPAFDSFAEFLAMGDHGFYVWLAYGITFAVLLALVLHASAAHKNERRLIRARSRRTSATTPSQLGERP